MAGSPVCAAWPTLSRSTITRRVTRAIIDKAQREGVVNVYPIGAITKGLKGQELAEMGQMQRAVRSGDV